MDPFEIGNDHAARIAENIGDDEELVPALVENEIGLRRGRAIRAFGQDAAFQFRGVARVDHAIDRGRHEHVARHREHFVRIDPVGFIESAKISFFDYVLLRFRDVDPVWIVKRDRGVADADDFHSRLEREG